MFKKLMITALFVLMLALPASAAQYDFGTINTTTTSGNDLAVLLQNWRNALNSTHSATSRPSYASAGTVWLDTTSSSLWLLKQYDGSSDVILGNVNTSTHKFTPYFNGAVAAALTGEAIGQGVEDDGAGNLRVKLDGSTLARSASGMKITPGGVGATELAATAVTAGSYTNASVTVDADGRVTAASSGGTNVVRAYLAGLALSNDAGTPNTKVDIAAGVAADDTNTVMMNSSGSLTINFGTTGANGLDTGAIAATKWYNEWLIAKADGTVAGFTDRSDLAGLSPTLPSGYLYKRRLGSVLTDGSSHIIAFVQSGDTFNWLTPVEDVNATNPPTTAVTRTLTVPTGVAVEARIEAGVYISSGGTSFLDVYVSALSQTDLAPQAAGTGSITAPITIAGGNQVQWYLTTLSVITNTSSQVRTRNSTSSTNDRVGVVTLGWVDKRGRDS